MLLNPGGFYIKGTATVHYVNGTVETGGTTAIAPSISGTSHITMGMDETVTRTVDLGAGYFEATGYTVASEDPSIATAVQNDNTITITGVAMGTTSVTVTWVGGALAGQTTSIGVEVTPRWGIDGIFNLSVLPSSNISGTDTNTPWSWDSTAQTLTLTGSGPYTIEGTANETARIVAVLNGNMEIEINGDLKAPPLTSGYDGHPALTASGNGDLILTGSGSLVGGTHPYWAGHGVRASELTGDVFISGSLQITGGYGNYCGGIGVRLSGNDLTLSGTVTLTGGNSGAGGVGSHGVYHDTSPYGNIFVSGQIAVTGGDGGYGQQNGVAIGGTGVGTSLIHFTDPDASLTVKNGQAVTTATARDFVNDTPNTRWDIDTSAIAGGGTVYDQNITVNIPASPGSLTVGLSLVSPSITTEPVNQAINEGQTASFSVESTGAQLTYQWQVNKQDGFGFQNVADGNGGNTAQYTTPITDVGMHGYVYWVIVSNPAGSVTSNIAELTVNALVNAEIPSITGQPESNVAYNQGSAATALSVTASVTDGGMLSYQWYENTINSNTGGTAVGTDSSTYTPSTATAGTLYYYCEVTNTNTGVSGVQTATNTSSVAAVVVNTLVNAEMPGITVHPQSATYNQGNTATPLSVTANVSDDGTLSYQWYENTINSNTGGTAVGTDSSTYTPGTATAGTLYYYCEVTNTNPGVNGVQTAALNSNTAAITVNHFSGGNSSSSSDDSSDSSIHSIVIGKQPDYPTVISVTGSTAGTAQKTFTITDSMVKTALDKALAEAKKLSRSPYGIGAQVALDAPATAITVTMERAGLNRLVSEKAKLFEVTGIPVASL